MKTAPIVSEYIQLAEGSVIHWEDRKRTPTGYAVLVTCGRCHKDRYVLRNSMYTSIRHKSVYTGLCRSCHSKPPIYRAGSKHSYKRTMRDGYITLVISGLPREDQELAYMMGQKNTGSPRILEHRLIMAKKLGRPLTRDETVHHINGNRMDNRPENLELHIGNHGKGFTMDDEITRLKAILDAHGIPY